MTPRYSVQVVAIARNEAPRLARMLRSVMPWVDGALVLDTGSDDGTPDIARACGARVEHFTWVQDFSAARNAALDRAGADWNLILDGDEWLIAGGEFLMELRHTAPDFVGVLRLEDHYGAEGSNRVDHWMSRLLPRGVRYAGRIHEQPSHAMPSRRVPLHLGHDGYSDAALQAKKGRNRQLLEAELRQQPGDAYTHYQYGKDAAVYDEHGTAAAHLAQALGLDPRDTPWRLDAVTRLIFSLKRLGRHAEAVEVAQAEEARGAPAADIAFALGDVLLDWAVEDPAQCVPRLIAAAQAWERCLDMGERPHVSGSVQGRGSRLAAHNLALVCEGLGDVARAQALRRNYGLTAGKLLS